MQLKDNQAYLSREGKVVIVRKTQPRDGNATFIETYPYYSDATELGYGPAGHVFPGSTYTDSDDLIAEIHGTETLTQAVLVEVERERTRQDAKWGVQNHGPMVWLGILAEEFGEVAKDANDYHFAKPELQDYKLVRAEKLAGYRAELVQVAAVAVAMIESLDRNEGKK